MKASCVCLRGGSHRTDSCSPAHILPRAGTNCAPLCAYINKIHTSFVCLGVWGNIKIGDSSVSTLASKNIETQEPVFLILGARCCHFLYHTFNREVWNKCHIWASLWTGVWKCWSSVSSLVLGSPERRGELHSMILRGPFQLKIFYEYWSGHHSGTLMHLNIGLYWCTWKQCAKFLIPCILESRNFREFSGSLPETKEEQIQGCALAEQGKLLPAFSLEQTFFFFQTTDLTHASYQDGGQEKGIKPSKQVQLWRL